MCWTWFVAKSSQWAGRWGKWIWARMRAARAPAAAYRLAAGRWLCGTCAGRRTAGIGLLILAAVGWIGGCPGEPDQPAESLAAIRSQDAAPSAATTDDPPPVAVTVLKISTGDADPLDVVFAAQEAVRAQTSVFVDRLLLRLSSADAAYIRSLQRVYTTGQLLRELQRWTTEAENADLVDSAARDELARLLDRWIGCERQIAGLAEPPAALCGW